MRIMGVILALLVAESALAGPFTHRTSMYPLPAHEVERPLILSRGWLELGLGYSHHMGLGAWTDEGRKEKFDHAKWKTMTTSLTVKYGLSSQSEVWFYLPYEMAHLKNEALGTNIFDHTIGDPRFGVKVEVLGRDAPRSSVIVEVAMKGAAAKESPGTYIGGPINVSGFVFTTGTTDVSLNVAAKQQLGPIGLVGHVGYVYRFGGVVQYLVDLDQHQFAGRIKPGDRLEADVEVMAQLAPVVISVRPEFQYRLPTQLGTTSRGATGNDQLSPVANSAGWAVDLHGEIMLQATRGFDFVVFGEMPLRGEDLQFFPIEDLQPTYGPTFGGRVEARY